MQNNIQIQKRSQQGSSPQPSQQPTSAWPNATWGGKAEGKPADWQFSDQAGGDASSLKSGSVLSSPGKLTPTDESPNSSTGSQSWGGDSTGSRGKGPQASGWGSGSGLNLGGESSAFASAIVRNTLPEGGVPSGAGKEFSWGGVTTTDSLTNESGGWGNTSTTTSSSGGWGMTSSGGSKEGTGAWDNTQDIAAATLPSSLAECWQTSDEQQKPTDLRTTTNPRPDSLQWSSATSNPWQSESASPWTDNAADAGVSSDSGSSSWPQQQTSLAGQQQQPATSAASAAGGSAASLNAAPGSRPQSKEDIIARAVNSKESWGKIPVRQDTPWDLEEPPKPPPVVRTQSQQPTWGVSQPSSASAGGSAPVWESIRQDNKEPPMRSGSRGSSSGSDSLEWNASSKDNDLGNWVGPPMDDNANTNSGNTWRSGGSDTDNGASQWGGSRKMEGSEGSWGGGGGGGRGGSSSSWADESDGGGWDGGKTETGTWEDPNATSTGTWEGGDGSGGGGADIDNGTSMWGASGGGAGGGHQRQSSWSGQSGPKDLPSRPSDPTDPASWASGNMQGKSWGESPGLGGPGLGGPGLGGPGMGGPGQTTPTSILQSNWNDPRKMQSNNFPAMSGGGGRTSQMMRSQMLQELVRQGFKKEDAQGALIANNMNFESARADLLAAASGRRTSVDVNKGGRQLRGSSVEDLSDVGSPMMGGPPPQLPSSMMPGHIPPPGVLGPSAMTGVGMGPGGMQPRMPAPSVPAPIRGMSVPPPTMGGPRGAAGGAGVPTPQQQAMMQQLLTAISQQSPVANSLLQQLPANQQVMLQQIVQIKAMLQKLSTEQQAILRSPNPQQHRQSLEQLQRMMQQLTVQEQQYIVALFQTPQQQQAMGKQPPPLPGMAPPMAGAPSDLGLANLSIRDPWKQDSDKLNTPPGVDVSGGYQGWGDPSGQWGAQKGKDGVPGMSPGGSQRLDIEEFIPGRPWQGSLVKGPDDPSLPGSAWSQGGTQWPGDVSGGDLWGAGGIRGARPPTSGQLGQQNAPRPQQWQRSMSWAPEEHMARPPGMAGAGGSANWLAIKNVTPQVDINVLRVLCTQVGACQVFPVPKAAQLMVRYNNRDDVIRAQKHISGRQLGNAKVIADVVVDPNVLQMLDSLVTGGANAAPSAPSWNVSSPSGAGVAPQAGGWGSQGTGGGGGGGLWASGSGGSGAWSSQDGSSMLPGDLLGGH